MVVRNTPPIINLACVGQLDLLQALYGGITIPRAVHAEIALPGSEQPGATEVQQLAWITTCDVTNRHLVDTLKLELDAGEAEAIACALDMHADLLLIDEHIGRVVARRLGLRFIGLPGVLIEAKHKGLIPAVRPVLDDLIVKAGFWISHPLYTRVLEETGEAR